MSVFISYSRKDIAFAKILVDAIKLQQIDPWIDWEDIPPSTDWWTEVKDAIEKADAFIFVISRFSIQSEVCEKEIQHALNNNKRIIPIITEEVDPGMVTPTLANLNWIFFRKDQDDFQKSFDKLLQSIQTDWNWVKAQTRLQVRALEWERKECNASYLLRGQDLKEAEEWQTKASHGAGRQLTAIQANYILASRENANRSQRSIIISLCFGLLITLMLAYLAWTQRNQALIAQSNAESAGATAISEAYARATAQTVAEQQTGLAEEQKTIAIAKGLAVQSDLINNRDPKNLPLALLLALESYKQYPTLEVEQPLRNALSLMSKPVFQGQIIPASSAVYDAEDILNPITIIRFSHNGQFLAVGCEKEIITVFDTSTWKQVLRVESSTSQGYQASVTSLSFSPDDHFLVNGSQGGFTQVWDLATGQELSKYENSGQVFVATFTHDGKRIISGASGKMVVWDPFSGTVFYFLETGTDYLALSPDGKMAASASENQITVWDINSGQIINTKVVYEPTPYDTSAINAITFSPDGSMIASSVGESGYAWTIPRPKKVGGEILVWDVDTGSEIIRMQHGDSVPALSFSSDGMKLVSGSFDETSRVWEIPSGRPLQEISFQSKIGAVVFGKNDGWILSSGFDGTARIWDTNSGKELNRLITEQDFNLKAIAISQDGELVAGGNDKGQIWIWKPSGQEKLRLELGKALTISSASYSPDGIYLTTGSWDNTARVWDLTTGSEISRILHENQVTKSTFSPDGKMVASSDLGGVIKIWDPLSGKLIFEPPKTDNISEFLFSPDSRLLITSMGTDPKFGFINTYPSKKTSPIVLTIWDISRKTMIFNYQNTSRINSLSIDPIGGILIFGGDDNKIHKLDLSTLKVTDTSIIFNNRVNLVRISPDGLLAASVESRFRNTYGTDLFKPVLKVWKIDTEEIVWETQLEGRWVTDLKFSPDGKLVASNNIFLNQCITGVCKNSTQVWDAKSGNLISQKSYEYNFGLIALAFNKTGTLLASGGGYNDGTGWVDVWDPVNQVDAFRYPFGRAFWTEFSPDDDTVAITGDQNGPAYVDIIYTRVGPDLVKNACSRLTRNMTQAEWHKYLKPLAYQETCQGLSSSSPQPNGVSDDSIISANGQFVVFKSKASNLVCNDRNKVSDIFLYDVTNNSLQRISSGVNGEGNASSFSPSISADGRYILYISKATNLTSDQKLIEKDNDPSKIPVGLFLFDRIAQSTELITSWMESIYSGDNIDRASISSDGQLIVFSSPNNLVINDTNQYRDIYLYNVLTKEIQIISSQGLTQSNGDSVKPYLSSDGRLILFYSTATNLDPVSNQPGWFLVRRIDGGIQRLNVNWDGYSSGSSPLSGDGQLGVGIEYREGDGSFGEYELDEVVLLSISMFQNKLASISSNKEPGNRDSSSPAISENGQHIIFSSEANNLVEDDTNIAWDIFFYDILSEKLECITSGWDGSQANGHSFAPSISGLGGFATFTSTANNLIPNDSNGLADVFIYNFGTKTTIRIEPTCTTQQ